MCADAVTPAPSPSTTTSRVAVSPLAVRRAAIAAALRAVATEPVEQPPAVDHSGDIAGIRTQLRRLTERMERVEDEVDLLRNVEEQPLQWPAAVEPDSRLEVPPLDVSSKSSPAFDVLLGPPKRDTA